MAGLGWTHKPNGQIFAKLCSCECFTCAVVHLTWHARPCPLFPVSMQTLAICFNILIMPGSVTLSRCLWLCNSSPSHQLSSSCCWWFGNYVFLLFVFFGLMTNFVLNILILMSVLWISIFTLSFFMFSTLLTHTVNLSPKSKFFCRCRGQLNTLPLPSLFCSFKLTYYLPV